MPSSCVVPFCKSRSATIRFPQDPILRKKWIEAIKRDNYEPSKFTRICRLHFINTDYYIPVKSSRETPRGILKKNSVPSIFAWSPAPDLIIENKEYDTGLNQRKRKKNTGANSNLNDNYFVYQEVPIIESVDRVLVDNQKKGFKGINEEHNNKDEVTHRKTNCKNKSTTENTKFVEIEICFDEPIINFDH